MNFKLWLEARSKWLPFEELNPTQQAAVLQSTKGLLPLHWLYDTDRWRQHVTDYAQQPQATFEFNVQTIPTQQLIDRFAKWDWTEDVLDKKDWQRIKKIMKLPRWPYVSFLAPNFKSIEEPFFHGDGYHRVWAAYFNKEPSIEIIYIRKKK